MKFFDRKKPFILDGGLATEIARLGFDLNHPLWSARALKESPEMIFEAHLNFLKAGAEILLTSSYQASVSGFRAHGMYDREARETIFSSVMLACYARDKYWEQQGQEQGHEFNDSTRPELSQRKKILIGGSCGPFSAILADGSEYKEMSEPEEKSFYLNHYKNEVLDYYQNKIEVLLAPRKNFKCDFLAFETLPSAFEAELISQMMMKYRNAKYWLSFTNLNSALKAVKKMAQNPQVIGFGLNCVSIEKACEGALQLEPLVKNSVSGSLVLYPNSGAQYDKDQKKWISHPSHSTDWAQAAQQMKSLQAQVIGGCCEVTSREIQTISSALSYKP